MRIVEKDWTIYRKIEGTLNKSSQKLIITRGMHNKDNGILPLDLLKKRLNKSNIKTGIIKDNPPPLGMGVWCKLLWLGLSKEYRLSNLIPLIKIIKEENKPKQK